MSIRILLVLVTTLALAVPVPASEPPSQSPYVYTDTRRLVELVEDAAAELEKKGPAFFGELGKKGSQWFTGETYFFAYDTSGTCAFHAVFPELVGRNLIDLNDMNGKPVIRRITEIAALPMRDASGWVFYLWEEGSQFSPTWKSSYVRKAVTPDGTVYLIGSGSYHIKIERAFVKDRVTMAGDLLRSKGREAAFAQFRDPASPFCFLGTYIFVMDIKGRAQVDPAYPNLAGRDLTRFRDAVGHYVVRDMIQKLERTDEAWVQFMWPEPGATLPSRKLAYIRKVTAGGETYIVGSDFFTATPIWMKP